jgi:hypothetical protein
VLQYLEAYGPHAENALQPLSHQKGSCRPAIPPSTDNRVPVVEEDSGDAR